MMKRSISLVVIATAALVGCRDSRTADDVKPCVKSSAVTAGEAAKTGGKTAAEGVKTFGRSVGGLFEGGTDEAKEKWKEGAQKTKETAHEGGSETRTMGDATRDQCK